MFATKGFQRATTKDIAQAADVSEGTIYNYFESKDALLIALLNDLAQTTTRDRALISGLNVDFRTFFKQLIRERIAFMHDRYDVFLAVLPAVLQSEELRAKYYGDFLKPTFAALEDHIDARIKLGESRTLDIPLTVRLYSAMALGMQLMMILGDEEIKTAWDDPDRLADAITAVFFDGIGGH